MKQTTCDWMKVKMLRLIMGCILICLQLMALGPLSMPAAAAQTADGSVLPFTPAPSASKAGPTLQESTHQRRVEPNRLPKGAPNILMVLIDDVGFAQTDTFGGEMHTPALSRLANEGIRYNAFHTTAICSPTRAALLTGRNHHRVGNGTIAERATDFDGYSGVIPKTSATIAEVLHHYGYKSSAFGKWHNTPANQTTTMGPFDRWPTGHGFDYFYGFIAGETSQYEPRLYENINPVEPPHDEKYHLTEDMAAKAIAWLKQHQAFSPDKPFFMYWAPGAAHGPHHIFKEWADKYKGKFNDGWDAYRERVFKRQKELGWIPAGTKLTPRPDTLAAWDSVPESERPFQRRLMELFAGFVEHTDAQVGKLIDSLEELGLRDNTLVFYIWGDNGASAEGQQGSISELLAQNNIPNTVEQQMAALEKLGGLELLGTPTGPGRAALRSGRPSWSPPTSAEPVTPWWFHGRKASSRTRRRVPSFTTSTTSCRLSMKSSASGRPKWWMASSKIRSTASAWFTRSRTQRRLAARKPSTSRTTAAGASTMRGGTPARLGRSFRGIPLPPPRG